MKKIFTLVFSVGLLTSAFAQTNRHQQAPQNNSNGYQQTQPPVATQRGNQNGYSKSYGSNSGYNNQTASRNDDRNTAQWNQPAKQQYGYDRDRETRDREMMMKRNQHYTSRFDNQKRNDYRNDEHRDGRNW